MVDLVKLRSKHAPRSSVHPCRGSSNGSIYRTGGVVGILWRPHCFRRFSLNTTPELYNALKHSIKAEAHVLDDLDRRTLQLFIDDFEQCGVHLEENKVYFKCLTAFILKKGVAEEQEAAVGKRNLSETQAGK